MEVKGIGEKLFLTLKPYVSISGPTTLDVQGSPLLLFSPPFLPPGGPRRSPRTPSRWARDGDPAARPGPSGPRAPFRPPPAWRCPS